MEEKAPVPSPSPTTSSGGGSPRRPRASDDDEGSGSGSSSSSEDERRRKKHKKKHSKHHKHHKRHKHKKHKRHSSRRSRSRSPSRSSGVATHGDGYKLSNQIGGEVRDGDNVRYSALTGERIELKRSNSKHDRKEAERRQRKLAKLNEGEVPSFAFQKKEAQGAAAIALQQQLERINKDPFATKSASNKRKEAEQKAAAAAARAAAAAAPQRTVGAPVFAPGKDGGRGGASDRFGR